METSKLKKYYATATGLYSDEDFGGPPPMSYDLVYMATDVNKLVAKTLTEFCGMPSDAFGDYLKETNGK